MKVKSFVVLMSFLTGASVTGVNTSSSAPPKSRKTLAPASSEGTAYCSRHYGNFNPKTGTFKSSNRKKNFCAGKTKNLNAGNSNPWPPYPRYGKTSKQWQECVFEAFGVHEGYSASDCNDQS